VPYAKRFVAHLETTGLINVQGGRTDVLYVTPDGRNAFAQFCNSRQLPKSIEEFLRAEMKS